MCQLAATFENCLVPPPCSQTWGFSNLFVNRAFILPSKQISRRTFQLPQSCYFIPLTSQHGTDRTDDRLWQWKNSFTPLCVQKGHSCITKNPLVSVNSLFLQQTYQFPHFAFSLRYWWLCTFWTSGFQDVLPSSIALLRKPFSMHHDYTGKSAFTTFH